jgi:hypothetical protein
MSAPATASSPATPADEVQDLYSRPIGTEARLEVRRAA